MSRSERWIIKKTYTGGQYKGRVRYLIKGGYVVDARDADVTLNEDSYATESIAKGVCKRYATELAYRRSISGNKSEYMATYEPVMIESITA